MTVRCLSCVISSKRVFITSDKGEGKCICLFVCLLARLLKNACMDFDEMLLVGRCRDMDELILLSPMRIIVQMPEPDCFLHNRISLATRKFTSGKSHMIVLARSNAAATRCFIQSHVKTTLSEVHALHRVPF